MPVVIKSQETIFDEYALYMQDIDALDRVVEHCLVRQGYSQDKLEKLLGEYSYNYGKNGNGNTWTISRAEKTGRVIKKAITYTELEPRNVEEQDWVSFG